MPKKILVVNMNYMGDALLTTPALAALRRANPDAQIDTVVGAGAATEILRGNPDINIVIPRTAQGSLGRCVQLFRLLRAGRYTDAIILPPLPAYAATAWLARTPNRIGQTNRGMNRFLTELRPVRTGHMAEAMLDTVPHSETDRPSRRLKVAVAPDALAQANRLLTDVGIDTEKPLVIVNVGATRPQKRWFAESFAAVLDELLEAQTVLIGSGPDDAARAADVLARTRRARPANLVGKTNVKTLAAVLSRGEVVLSADSGPMHLATAVGVPTVALFGSTDPATTGPYDDSSRVLYKSLHCAPCNNHPTCNGRYDCMRAITPDEVVLEIRAFLRQRRGGSVQLRTIAPVVPAPRRLPAPRVLIETKFRFIGDTLLAIPIFRAARAQWPDARIVLLTGKNARTLLQNNPYLDEIIEYNPYKADKGLRADLNLVRRLRRERFDIALILNRSFHSALIPWASRIKTRAGFSCEGRDRLLTRPVDYDREKSEVACYFDVLQAAAPNASLSPELELWLTDTERREAAERVQAAFPAIARPLLIGIQPGASQAGKRWDAAQFAATADALISESENAHLVLVGGPDEREAADAMLTACRPETRARAVSFAGELSLRGSLALVSYLRLFVGNDTAVLHSAVALGVPTVALFGPTNPRKWGNYGLRHRVVEAPDGQMASLTASEVIAAARELLTTAVAVPA